jgi:uncharacterized protein with HEPN domain
MAIEACLYNIQIIGEAVNHLADTIKNDLPGLTKELKAIQNRLIEENQ